MTDTILALDNVHTHIGRHHILQGVTLDARLGRVTVLLGRNGAGKSTTLRTVIGLTPPSSGRIILAGQEIQNKPPYEIARSGVGFVPEDQAVIYSLTVEENFRLAMLREDEKNRQRMERVFELFPDLNKYWKRKAGLLSGGQKQMLAIGRVLVNDHTILLIDEPSKGLAPIIVQHLGESLIRIKHAATVILVEQNFYLAGMVGEDYFILDDGHVVHDGLMTDLIDNHELKQKYLGIA
jgi:branched-chain amino acid transport system ATP-binding protein